MYINLLLSDSEILLFQSKIGWNNRETLIAFLKAIQVSA